MNKPTNYDNVNIMDWVPLKPGGHKCVILKAEETHSKTENHYEMLVISFDIDEPDPQAGYYKNQYLRDKNAGRDATWHGVSYLVTDSQAKYGSENTKKLNTAVLLSNGMKNDKGEADHTQIVWGSGYCDWLKGKKVGIVFRQEEYTKYDGSFGLSTKPMRFCDYEKAEEQAVPKVKLKDPEATLSTQYQQFTNNPPPAQMTWDTQTQQAHKEGFMKIPKDALDDEGLPFN